MNTTHAPFGDLADGTVIDDFTVVRRLGEGGMANLYLVRDAEGMERVIKVPRQALGTDPVSYVAFENELRLAPFLADFPHACMPSTHVQKRSSYLVMDYIPGVDLWSYLKERGVLKEAEAVALARKIVRAVAGLHARRIVHLDIKLSNVMITPEGEARLVDFGLANHLDLPDLIYESFHEPKGTPAYIAPEQFIGVRDEPKSDVFSLGVMLFEMTTGKLPFPEAQSAFDVMRRIRKDAASVRVHAPHLSAAFEAIVQKCLKPNPDDRMASAQALLEALVALGATDSPEATVTAPPALPAPNSTGLLHRLNEAFRQVFVRGTDHLGHVQEWAEHRRANGVRPYRILAALDLGDGKHHDALNLAILREAQRLGRLQPSIITAMTAVAVDGGTGSAEKAAQEENDAVVKARKKIAELIALGERTEAPVLINVLTGQPEGAIERCVDEYDIQLVVIGCRPKRGFVQFLHGRNGYRIMTHVRRSLHVVYFDDKAEPVSKPASRAA